jgi:hypothetical protein
MNPPIPHYYVILQPRGIVARLSINDIPFYRRAVDYNMSPSGPFNHMLIPGDNVVTVELAEIPGMIADNIVRTFEFRILREEDDDKLFGTKYPDFALPRKEDERGLPIRHDQRFRVDFATPEPAWMSAEPGYFPESGTPELHEAFREYNEAFRKKDVGTFLHATRLRVAEHRRFYGEQAHLEDARAKSDVTELLEEPWAIEPVELSDLVFERHAEGRVAYVTRRDGRPAVSAKSTRDPQVGFSVNLLLTRHQGRWTIFG